MLRMFGRKYRINPETLRIEQARLPLRKRLFLGSVVLVFILATAIGMRILFDQHAKSPRLVYHERNNVQLRNEYQQLLAEIQQDEQMLENFRIKDDRFYRSIFGLDPLPQSIREAGTGGSEMFPSLNAISDPEIVRSAFGELENIRMKATIQLSSFEDLEAAARHNQELLACKPLLQPISPADQYWLTSTYGYRKDPFTKQRRAHFGIDLAGQHGLEVHAAGDGIVQLSEHSRYGYGNEVIIKHGFGYSSRYAHLQDIKVKPGEKVKRGQVIGTLGSSGRSTGPHLHYEIHLNGKTINPIYYYFENISADEYARIKRNALSE